MAGGTMGWFTYQDQKGTFFDPANSDRVAFIQRPSAARIAAKAWMVHGRHGVVFCCQIFVLFLIRIFISFLIRVKIQWEIPATARS